jgi:GNAT superfamily N-acetyltransferase
MKKYILEQVKKIISESPGRVNLRKFHPEDKEQVMNLMIKSFSHLMPESQIPGYTDHYTNYNKSIVAEQGGKIIGFYLLGDRQLRDGVESYLDSDVYVNLGEYDQKNGVEGVALVVADEAQGTGVGSKLKDYTKTVGADYIWGLQYKDLGNLDQWLRRRTLAAETPGINITLEDF